MHVSDRPRNNKQSHKGLRCDRCGLVTSYEYHKIWSTLFRVMASCVMAPGHYLNQCSLIISEILWHSPDGNFTRNSQDICPWYEFELLIDTIDADVKDNLTPHDLTMISQHWSGQWLGAVTHQAVSWAIVFIVLCQNGTMNGTIAPWS